MVRVTIIWHWSTPTPLECKLAKHFAFAPLRAHRAACTSQTFEPMRPNGPAAPLRPISDQAGLSGTGRATSGHLVVADGPERSCGSHRAALPRKLSSEIYNEPFCPFCEHTAAGLRVRQNGSLYISDESFRGTCGPMDPQRSGGKVLC